MGFGLRARVRGRLTQGSVLASTATTMVKPSNRMPERGLASTSRYHHKSLLKFAPQKEPGPHEQQTTPTPKPPPPLREPYKTLKTCRPRKTLLETLHYASTVERPLDPWRLHLAGCLKLKGKSLNQGVGVPLRVRIVITAESSFVHPKPAGGSGPVPGASGRCLF